MHGRYCFYVGAPVRRLSPAIRARLSEPNCSVFFSPGATMPRLVLLVDGNVDSHAIFQAVLQYRGYRVFHTRSAVEALAFARTHRPDLIIREHPVRLPDGSSLAAALKADPETSSIPIIAITSRVTPSEVNDALRDHSTRVLGMPVLPSEMAAYVEQLIGEAA